jgi:methyl-accepting chemotaxis protein
MRGFKNLSVAGKLLLAGGAVTGVLLLFAAVAVSQNTRSVARGLSHDYAEALSESAVSSLSGRIGGADTAARSIAEMIGSAHESGVRDRRIIMNMLKPAASSTPLVTGSWFMAAPGAFDGLDGAMTGRTDLGSNANGNFTPYWVNDGSTISMQPLNSANDYEQPYYVQPFTTGKPVLNEPYPYEVSGKTVLMTSIAYPVTSGGKVIGVAGVDLALGGLSSMLGEMKPFETGRVMLLSGAGNWVSHPDAPLLTKPYAEGRAEDVRAVISSGKATRLDGLRDLRKEPIERLVSPVPFAGLNATWALVTDIPSAAINGPADRLAIAMMIGGLVILGLVMAALLFVADRVVRRPLAQLTASVGALNAGRYDEPVKGTASADEVGGIARALDGFRHDLAEAGRLRAEQERDRAAAEAERRRNEAVRQAAEEEQKFVVASVGEGLSRLSDGDLTYRLQAAFPQDYRKLQDDFNSAMSRLEDTMSAIINSAGGIRSTTSEISQAADDLSRRTEQQAASLEETAAALEEVTTTIRHASDGAERARGIVDAARSNASRSGEVVNQAVAAMKDIEASASQITRITGVIDEIAFQTNLLALNAGVEAARAGDAGRGFAVVASEVRALAQRSAEAAKEIKVLIAASTVSVGQGVKLVDGTGDALNRIIAEVAEINSLVSDIAASSREQATGLAEINTAVNQMDQMTQQNAAMVEQSTAASHSLAQETGNLAEMMGRFRVSQGAPATQAQPAPARATRPAQRSGTVAMLKTVGGRTLSAAASQAGWEEF